MGRLYSTPNGPFTADQVKPGDPYELSNGHAIHCLPSGGRHSGANAEGASVIGSDPEVESVGVDAGFTPEPGTLRAPDVAVGVSDEPGWSPGVPPLALEYADRGQDEDDLTDKIRDLLAAGTKYVWVVRLDGPRRVEIHRPKEKMRLAHPGDELKAPGVLRNPVPVEALYDKEAAQKVTLRNLLQRQGYEDLDAVRDEGVTKGKAQGIAEGELQGRRTALLDLCEAKELALNEQQGQQIQTCTDTAQLKDWLVRAATADTTDDIFD